MMKPKVLVSHPGRQHAHQLVFALQEVGYLVKFVTSIWYKPGRFPYKYIGLLPVKLKGALEKELRKRYYEGIDENFIEQFPFFDILRESFDRLFKGYKRELSNYLVNRIHDCYVSKRIERIKPDIILGYETSSLRSFRKAKENGKISILDLVSAPYWFQRKIWSICKFDPYDESNWLSDQIGRVKQEEIDTADYIFIPSEYVKSILLKADIPERKILKIPFGASSVFFKPKADYRKNSTFRILYVGSMTKGKGINYMLQALKELALDNVELILIGPMADGKAVLKQYQGSYKYIPFLHHEDLSKHYQEADIFVFPSLLEGFAQVVIEAMACGTPVIVTQNSGSSDAVRDGTDGFIVPIMDVESLKGKILYFYENREKIKEMGKNAASAAQDYTWESYRKRVREIIEEIWNKRVSGLEVRY